MITGNDRLSTQGSIKPWTQIDVKWGKGGGGSGGIFYISGQVRLSAHLKSVANLNKMKMIFVIKFGRNFLIFVKNLLAWHFLLFSFF